MTGKNSIKFMQGNAAIAEGALAAGASFFAGYPITPSSEVAEISSMRLPGAGGVYVQMEDEMGSIAAVIGASVAGKKSYTATSGPGFSLMQENLGVAVMAEVPCVIINVQRSGPSTGLATKPAQGDVMQSRWGTHGDHGIIVISPSSVQDCYDFTIRAFNLAEKYRTPVVLLADEIVGHMREKVVLKELGDGQLIERSKPDCHPDDYKPFGLDGENAAPLASYGSQYVFRVSGSTHDERGFASSKPDNADKYIRHYTDKIEKNKDDIIITREYNLSDAEYIIITFGCTTRSALEAMSRARSRGRKVGVLELVTLWPFADAQVSKACQRANAVIVPEMNLGQVIREVQRVARKDIPIAGVNKVNSQAITPIEILDRIEEVARCL